MLTDVTNLFEFLGGLGMFLYGMNLMADGMQKTAGGKMQKFLEMLTTNKFMAVGLGALVTAIIQSSGATTVMVVGFVSAGVMSLTQAVGVIMGANIGTTITAWIVSMSQLGDAFELMKPEFYAPLLVGLGALVLCFSRLDKKKMIGEIILGLGLLFLGLKTMSAGIKPYTNLPIFAEAFAVMGGNPFLGAIVGCVVTALLQSSSASVGILQTLAMNGIVTKSAAIYITLGQNIGSCVTALISSIGAPKVAKRAAVIHLLFNCIGAVVFGTLGFIVFSINKQLAVSNIDSVQISIFHTFFNFIMTALLLPFSDVLVKLSGFIVKGDEEITKDKVSVMRAHLDKRILETPAIALESVINEVIEASYIAGNNVRLSIDAVLDKDAEKIKKVAKVEKTINKMQSLLTEYLMKLDTLSLTDKQKLILSNLYYAVSDIERVGDHADNISENANSLLEKNVDFSDTAKEDLKKIADAALLAYDKAIEARKTGSLSLVQEVNKIEMEVDFLEDELREKHIERLVNGKCNPEAGILFLDIISNLERISDHATNLAEYITKEI
jgi:Na/Pi-cotransporter II-like protein